jgi:hypothetical protein
MHPEKKGPSFGAQPLAQWAALAYGQVISSAIQTVQPVGAQCLALSTLAATSTNQAQCTYDCWQSKDCKR